MTLKSYTQGYKQGLLLAGLTSGCWEGIKNINGVQEVDPQKSSLNTIKGHFCKTKLEIRKAVSFRLLENGAQLQSVVYGSCKIKLKIKMQNSFLGVLINADNWCFISSVSNS